MARGRHGNPLAAMEQAYGATALPKSAYRPGGGRFIAGAASPSAGPQAKGKGRRARSKNAKTFTLRKKGKKPATFKKGALHQQLNVPQSEPIPESKKQAALAGRYGPLAKKRAVAAFEGILAAGRKKARRRK